MSVCPYCYSAFAPRRIEFRCPGRPSPGAPACPPRPDEHLRAWFADSTPVPPAFTGNGLRRRAACPACGGETTVHLCPHCHSRLPVHFGAVDARLIATVGPPRSGKTVFMTVLIHELMHRVGRVLDAALVGADDATRGSFEVDHDRRLYAEHRLPGPTAPLRARTQRRPLVFRLTLRRRRQLPRLRVRVGRGSERHTVLSFLDAAGEDLASTDGVELNARYLTSADGIVVLLDPLQLPGAREQALLGTPLPDPGPDTPFDVLTRITELLREPLADPSAPIRTPVAVVLPKLDALAHTFVPGTPLTRHPPPRPGFDDADSRAVHDQIASLLDDWDGPRIEALLRHHYASYRFFGISALGTPPTAADRVAPVRPQRAHHPLFWLLDGFGTIGRVPAAGATVTAWPPGREPGRLLR